MSILELADDQRGKKAKTHLIFSSELDPNSVLRFVLVICRTPQLIGAEAEWCLIVNGTHS